MFYNGFQDIANNLTKFIDDKSLFVKFTPEDVCRILDHCRLTIDQTHGVLQLAKGKLTPEEVVRMIQHFHCNFGWDANKAANISLLLSDLLKSPFYNEYIKYFLKKIQEFYEDDIKESKRVKKRTRIAEKENKTIKEDLDKVKLKLDLAQTQIEAFQQIQQSHIQCILELQSELENNKEEKTKMNQAMEKKDSELQLIRDQYAKSTNELLLIKKQLEDKDEDAEENKDSPLALQQSKTKVAFDKNASKKTDENPDQVKAKLTSEISSLNVELAKVVAELNKEKEENLSLKDEIKQLKKKIEELEYYSYYSDDENAG